MAWKHQDSLSVMGRFLLLRRQHSALLYSTTVWYAVPLLYLERFVGKDEVGEQDLRFDSLRKYLSQNGPRKRKISEGDEGD